MHIYTRHDIKGLSSHDTFMCNFKMKGMWMIREKTKIKEAPALSLTLRFSLELGLIGWRESCPFALGPETYLAFVCVRFIFLRV